ncbi:hypothetical protein Hamer_G010783, partial [Homarus americanus]
MMLKDTRLRRVSICGGRVLLMMMMMMGGGRAQLVVEPNSPYCTQRPTFLTCDFKGAQKDVDDKGTLNTPENMDDKERLDALQDESGISTSPKFDHKSQNPRRSPKHPSNSYTPAHRCINSSPLIWLLPTLLATVEAFIIIANCTNWFPALKSRQIRRGVEEGGRS